jgi:hypothetical protein
VERGVVHDQHRPGFRPAPAMLEKLRDEVFEDGAICRSLEHAMEEHTILGVRREDLMPTVAVELRYLHRSNTER